MKGGSVKEGELKEARPTGKGGNKCGATRKTDGGKCKNPAGAGTDHKGWGKCQYHGGNSPSLKKAAAREEAEAEVERIRMGSLVDIGPAEALVMEVQRAAGLVAFLDSKMADLGSEDITVLTELGYRPRAYMDVYRKEREHLARVSKMTLDAGVAERQVRVAEQHGAQVAALLQRVIDRLELDSGQRKLAPVIVREELMRLGAGS